MNTCEWCSRRYSGKQYIREYLYDGVLRRREAYCSQRCDAEALAVRTAEFEREQAQQMEAAERRESRARAARAEQALRAQQEAAVSAAQQAAAEQAARLSAAQAERAELEAEILRTVSQQFAREEAARQAEEDRKRREREAALAAERARREAEAEAQRQEELRQKQIREAKQRKERERADAARTALLQSEGHPLLQVVPRAEAVVDDLRDNPAPPEVETVDPVALTSWAGLAVVSWSVTSVAVLWLAWPTTSVGGLAAMALALAVGGGVGAGANTLVPTTKPAVPPSFEDPGLALAIPLCAGFSLGSVGLLLPIVRGTWAQAGLVAAALALSMPLSLAIARATTVLFARGWLRATERHLAEVTPLYAALRSVREALRTVQKEARAQFDRTPTSGAWPDDQARAAFLTEANGRLAEIEPLAQEVARLRAAIPESIAQNPYPAVPDRAPLLVLALVPLVATIVLAPSLRASIPRDLDQTRSDEFLDWSRIAVTLGSRGPAAVTACNAPANLQIEATVQPNGRLSNLRLLNYAHPPTENCLEAELARWAFPREGDYIARVAVTLGAGASP